MPAPVPVVGATTPAQAHAPVARASPSRRLWLTLFPTGVALCFLVAPVAVPFRLRLVWNVSASVPVGLYRLVPSTSPLIGDLVAVRPSAALARFMAARRYVEAGAVLVKPVAAVSGQHVCRSGAIVTLDGERIATALAADRLRRPLPVWTGCRRLRRGEVFLLVPDVAASFDSRYFGPVAKTAIAGRAVPLWTRP